MANLQRLMVLTSFLAMLPMLSRAQTATTFLRGTISDPQGAVIQGANATLANPNTGFSQSRTTDAQGFYQFLQVSPGTYTLTVTKRGFGTTKEDNLHLLVDVPATSNLTLHVRTETSTVEVTSNAIQVNSEDATLGNAFGRHKLNRCHLKVGIQRRS